MKSASRQIGAMNVGEMAWDLEKAGKDRDIEFIKSYNEKLISMFRDILGRLAKYFPEETVDESSLKPMDISEMTELLDDLCDASDSLDMDSMEEVEGKIREYAIPDELKEIYEKLYKAIGDMETDQCIELAEEIKDKL